MARCLLAADCCGDEGVFSSLSFFAVGSSCLDGGIQNGLQVYVEAVKRLPRTALIPV